MVFPDVPGTSHRIFSAIAAQNIAVDMIAQSVGAGGKASIGFTVLRNDLNPTMATLRSMIEQMGGTIRTVEDVSKVSVVGTGMRTHFGVAQRMFAALAAEKINMKMITTGDIKISVLVDRADGTRALKAVHEQFALHLAPRSPSLDEPPTPSPASAVSAGPRLAAMEEILISGVQLDNTYGRVTVFDLPDLPGTCSKVFEAVAADGISVDMIVQNLTGPSYAELSFTVPRGDLERALIRTREVVSSAGGSGRIVGDPDVSILYVDGVGMRTHTGVARTMFGALAREDINILMINTSEVCVGVVVALNRGNEALRCLKEAFAVA